MWENLHGVVVCGGGKSGGLRAEEGLLLMTIVVCEFEYQLAWI